MLFRLFLICSFECGGAFYCVYHAADDGRFCENFNTVVAS